MKNISSLLAKEKQKWHIFQIAVLQRKINYTTQCWQARNATSLAAQRINEFCCSEKNALDCSKRLKRSHTLAPIILLLEIIL